MTSTMWPTESWSVFVRPTRTNNDVEGWHNRLNTSHKTGSGNKGRYTLAPLLHEESDCLPLNAQFISEGKLKKIQKKPNRTMEMYILDNWERYINAEKSVSRVVGHGLEESDKPRTVPTMHHVVPILEPNRRSIECRD